MTRSDSLAILLSALLLAAPLRAEPTTVQKSTADALFKEGKKAMDAKDWDSACPKLAESHRLQPGGGGVLALALCHEQQKRFASALAEYKEAVFLARRDKRKDREDAASQKVVELEQKVSHLTLRMSDGAKAQGVEIELDGSAIAASSIGVAFAVDGGKHVVVAKAAGRVTRTTEISIAPEKESREIVVEPLENEAKKPEPIVASKPPEKQPSEPPHTSSRRTFAVIAGSVSLVAIGVGTYFGLRASSLHGDVKTNCPDLRCSDPSYVDRNDDSRKFATISTVSFVVGGVALATGIVLFATGGANDSPKQGGVRSSVALGLGSATWKLAW
ncbi:MAG: hypothetical protein ACXWUG_31265 [Polyangiales bacterium]